VRQVWLFDIDGTLITTGGAGEHAARLAMQSEFGTSPHSGEIWFAGRTDRSITSDLFQLHNVEDTPESWRRFQRAYLEHLRRLLPQKSGRVLPGVLGLLDYLRQQPVLLGLVTGNVRDAARVKLQHFQIDDFFTFGGFGDEHHDRQDVARTALELARSQLAGDLDPRDVCVVGDTPNDVHCGRAIGARTLAVATGSYTRLELIDAGPDVLLDDLTDLERVRSIMG
jgi:phosphoglycolate phosphatase-like HAD superfamily hydrolase